MLESSLSQDVGITDGLQNETHLPIGRIQSDCANAYLAVYDGAGDMVDKYSVGCSLGHKGPYADPLDDGGPYDTNLWIQDSSGDVLAGNLSPGETLSW